MEISYILHTPRPLVVFCFDRWLFWYVRVSHFSISIFELLSAPVCSPVRPRYSATRGIAAKGSWVRSQIGGRFPVVGWGWTDWICDFRWLRDLRCSMSRFGIFGPYNYQNVLRHSGNYRGRETTRLFIRAGWSLDHYKYKNVLIGSLMPMAICPCLYTL